MKWLIAGLGFAAIWAMAYNLNAADPIVQYPMDAKLEGPQGLYTEAMIKLIKTWPGENPAREPDYQKEGPVVLSQVKTVGRDYYIGIEQKMLINASIEEVEKVVDAIDQYHNMFGSLKDSKFISKEGNKWLTAWEQTVPVFFIPNVKFSMTYVTDKSNQDRKFYRYQLTESKSVLFDDGVVVLERSGSQTKFTKYDFYEPDLGIAKIFAGGKVWNQSFIDMFAADLAIKLKAENPTWNYSKVVETAEKAQDSFSTDAAFGRQGHFPVQVTVGSKATEAERVPANDLASKNSSR